jgi:putative transposase
MSSLTFKDRSSNRLPGYDYSQPGAYFVTISSYHRKCIFGHISNGIFLPNPLGEIVWEEWFRSEHVREEVEMDAFVLMPNHLHGIVWITDRNSDHVGATGRSPLRKKDPPRGPTKSSLGAFIGGFKAITTSRINQIRHSKGKNVWQRNYYDHIIRNERDLNRIRVYILENPLSWEQDQFYFKLEEISSSP